MLGQRDNPVLGRRQGQFFLSEQGLELSVLCDEVFPGGLTTECFSVECRDGSDLPDRFLDGLQPSL